MTTGEESATENPRKASRRSHAQRSASTRAKVIAAARDVLFSQGYSGATMHTIRDAAGMSLGAIQHQFPTKAKLMAAVFEEASARRTKVYAAAIRRGTTARESMENLLDANLEMIVLPEAAAVLEIHLARRNDGELDREVQPGARRFDRRVSRWGHRILRAGGVENSAFVQSLQVMNNAITRGLTVEYVRNRDKRAIDRAAKTWKAHVMTMLFDRGEQLGA